MKKVIFILSLLFMVSCAGNHDGVVLQDKNGKVYRLEHEFGDKYTIEIIDFSDTELDLYQPKTEE